MTAAEWVAAASKRDRLLVWQRDEPIDLPLPRDPEERAEVYRLVRAEFSRGSR